MIYEAREDSLLMQKQIKKYSNKKIVLDIGTGSGIQAEEASKYAKKVLATDINPEAIKYCKKKYSKIKNMEFRESNLFNNIKEKFDLIIFNPPYLPNEPKDPDIALDGGKEGWELTAKFLKQAKNHLKEEGVILLLFSSFTKKEKIEENLRKNKYQYKEIAREHIHFEDLYIFEIRKN